MSAHAVIFDLDGVLVTTDELHYCAWKQMADREGIFFDREVNHRLRGVSRMESLAIILEGASRGYSSVERERLADEKNAIYRAALERIGAGEILPGAVETLDGLDAMGVPYAVASSSRNAGLILERTGLRARMSVVVDGNDITRSKPDPQVFLIAAERLGVEPGVCVVVEDAESGVEAGLAAGMRVLGVGPPERVGRAHRVVGSLREIGVSELVEV
ncbi:MAG: beta-phosphoglucomutase [Phycisphaerales bacterium]|nr:beta-phosphoglucomutase [Phycisphaerales bacterium]